MTDSTDFDQIESLLMETPPPLPWAGEGLKWQILREARRVQRQQAARFQLSSLAAACLLFCLVSASQFSLEGTAQAVTGTFASLHTPSWFHALDQAQGVAGAEIGTWKHVEIALQHQQRISQKLSNSLRGNGTPSRTSTVSGHLTQRAECQESFKQPWLIAERTTATAIRA